MFPPIINRSRRTHSVFQQFFLSNIKNVLIYNKQTAYEAHLRTGTDLNTGHYNKPKLKYAHNMHKTHYKAVMHALTKNGILSDNIKTISTREEGINVLKNRSIISTSKESNSNRQKVFRPDIVIAVGGDGTFLRASHLLHPRLNTSHIPIVGINSNPEFSEGRLCLKAHENTGHTIAHIIKGGYMGVIKRQRIMINMTSSAARSFRTNDYYTEMPMDTDGIVGSEHVKQKVNDSEHVHSADLPIIALNDVFIGERASSMVSHLDIHYKYYQSEKDWNEHPPQKNSGIVCCTGTGSTGWSKSINRICSETTRIIAAKLGATDIATIDFAKFANEVNSYRTVFDPEHTKMGITFREPIYNKISTGTFSNFMRVSEIKVKSKLFHGMLSVDGSTFYSLPAGSVVRLSMNKAWEINCITLPGMHTVDT